MLSIYFYLNFKKESLKMTIEQSLSKPDSKIFTEDLKNLLYLTKNDTDLDLLLRALKRYDFI